MKVMTILTACCSAIGKMIALEHFPQQHVGLYTALMVSVSTCLCNPMLLFSCALCWSVMLMLFMFYLCFSKYTVSPNGCCLVHLCEHHR